MAAGGVILGGSGASVLYVGIKADALDRGIGALRNKLDGKGKYIPFFSLFLIFCN
ncbi:MAG: hypothetical protein ACW98F_16150 [Candidatus Hodarchaeales archaeon]|jgi:hypothetical protein